MSNPALIKPPRFVFDTRDDGETIIIRGHGDKTGSTWDGGTYAFQPKGNKKWVADMLNKAYALGRLDKADEIAAALGLSRR